MTITLYTQQDIVQIIDYVTPVKLTQWITLELVRPITQDDQPMFTDTDLARIRLIATLEHDIELSPDAVPIVLSLLDQIHDLRRCLKAVAGALDAQPSTVKNEIERLIVEQHTLF